MRRGDSHGSVIAGTSVWASCTRELGRADDGQGRSFAAVTVDFISLAGTLTAVEVGALSECEEFC